jgi:ABC-type transport system involved in multi-copper enzyme maturation permease subunit
MNYRAKLSTITTLIGSIFRYNLKIIFANAFIYFLLAAIGIFVLFVILNLVNAESNPNEATIYGWLLLPGFVLIFYPTIFGIQNDVDTGMIELLFSIPNYRYKVWLVRLVLIYLLVFAILLGLSLLASVMVVGVPVVRMALQLMFPIIFVGSLAFMLSTLVRNGYGTMVVMIIIGMALWIVSESLATSKWNLFLNPFRLPSNVNEAVWAETTFNNRLYLFIGSVISILMGLLLLQRREKFI